ncbi:MAG: lipoyl synthase [Cardiobacteriaceae bacterium]|nr:lipoyl synthase [Cardiobacteriaceae bacterium]
MSEEKQANCEQNCSCADKKPPQKSEKIKPEIYISSSENNQDKAKIRQKGAEKLRRLAQISQNQNAERLPKPTWIRAKLPAGEAVDNMKAIMRSHRLHSVCEEASCPNLGECFRAGSASFMILGDICTRRCPFCDVAHGRPLPPDADEPQNLAATVADLHLAHIVITSVDRDDLPDGGAGHFAACIREIRKSAPRTSIEILTPDFRGCEEQAIEILVRDAPDVFNHNLETIPRFYSLVRPGADYQKSLNLLNNYKKQVIEKDGKKTISKSGLMVGLGEELEEIYAVMEDLRANSVDMLTVGQYLSPSKYHLPVKKYYSPEEFAEIAATGKKMGFRHTAAAPLVRSSYFADKSAQELL